MNRNWYSVSIRSLWPTMLPVSHKNLGSSSHNTFLFVTDPSHSEQWFAQGILTLVLVLYYSLIVIKVSNHHVKWSGLVDDPPGVHLTVEPVNLLRISCVSVLWLSAVWSYRLLYCCVLSPSHIKIIHPPQECHQLPYCSSNLLLLTSTWDSCVAGW